MFAIPAAYGAMLLSGGPAALLSLRLGRTPLPIALAVGGIAVRLSSLFLTNGLKEIAPLAMMACIEALSEEASGYPFGGI